MQEGCCVHGGDFATCQHTPASDEPPLGARFFGGLGAKQPQTTGTRTRVQERAFDACSPRRSSKIENPRGVYFAKVAAFVASPPEDANKRSQ